MKPKPDYTLYLVTDSTPAILGDRNLKTIVAEAMFGGVSIVQYRDKTSDTGALIRTARELHAITKSKGVPLLINDRVDVALAMGAEGVHIGQDDMDLPTARRLLGPDAIIGVSASTVAEALTAAEQGADYLGIGTVYATATKTNTKTPLRPSGVRAILSALSAAHPSLPTVLIGGLNEANIPRTLYQSSLPTHSPSGIALVSAILTSSTPYATASALRTAITTPFPLALSQTDKPLGYSYDHEIVTLFGTLQQNSPFLHILTNTVASPLSASVALALGASPIMSQHEAESAPLAAAGATLLLNIGTLTPATLPAYLTAAATYTSANRRMVLDPVGLGATPARAAAVAAILAAGYPSVIKGNEAEIAFLAGAPSAQRGVDAGTSERSLSEKARIAAKVADEQRCVVVMTGPDDVITDGTRSVALRAGHAMLGRITGSGCALGVAVAAFLAVSEDPFLAAIAACLVLEGAAELAMTANHVSGPGTFVPEWIDCLGRVIMQWDMSGRIDDIDLEGL
ncbi:TMP-TENI-domain-containing protein [Trichodelitschia bisporula]|uniref:TMP-TENI-domain-containing protein n=1 Tax=Trichodelitschia bisporula TaxID=703511 RepID=A0A6G1HY13_9PEZI|nr:TMP-TENI-domain-containing protein [Trichodelitschia bisporula]